MTSISSTSLTQSYRDILARLANNDKGSAGSTTSTSSGSTTSNATDLALTSSASEDLAALGTRTRAALDALLAKAGVTSPLKDDGRLAVDLSSLDRRQLYAMASDNVRAFTADEEKAATLELQRRSDTALAGATAAARASGSIRSLYTLALENLMQAGPEEKASAGWQRQKTALESGLEQLRDDPRQLPKDNADDPVLAYLDRLSGNTDASGSSASAAAAARAALDLQKTVNAGEGGKASTAPDLSGFSAASLTAMVVSKDDTFSSDESAAARKELRQRANSSILSALKSGGGAGDLAQQIMSLYGGLDADTRQAAGLSDQLYQKAVSSYQTALKLESMSSSSSSSSDTSSLGFSIFGQL